MLIQSIEEIAHSAHVVVLGNEKGGSGKSTTALHIAVAAVHSVPYLLTWNCKHLANATMRTKIEDVCRSAGYEPVIICTPEELLEV